MHSFREAKQRDAAIVDSFMPVPLFVYGNDQFTIKLFAVSIKLRFSSGVRELIDALFYGSFHLRQVKTSHLKNCSVLSDEVPVLKKSAIVKFFVVISRRKTMHIASYLFSDCCFSAAKISLLTLTVASLDNHLVLHARCN